MKKSITKILALMLVLVLCASTLAACGKKKAEDPEPPKTDDQPITDDKGDTGAEEPDTGDTGMSTPLVVGYSPFSQKFSPFFAETAFDQDAQTMTQLSLLTLDRMGGVIYNAIEGETVSYNGKDYTYYGPADLKVERDEAADTTTYTAKLREDLKFSDGEPLTADDLIFTYYTFLDPAYAGSSTLASYDIVGLKAYMTQVPESLYAEYDKLAGSIFAAGADHKWAEADAWTEAQQTLFNDSLLSAWADHTQVITDYCVANYGDTSQDTIGFSTDEMKNDPGLMVAFGMSAWGFGTTKDGVLTGKGTEATFDLKSGVYPTKEDFAKEAMAVYNNDPVVYFDTEAVGEEADVLGTAKTLFITKATAEEPDAKEGVPNIAGIKKIDQYTIQITTNGYEAPAIYNILGQQIAPLHYYGDKAQYDYDNNKFGHPYGDLGLVESKTTKPLGAGPYKFIEFKDKIIYFEANESYYLGAPKTKYIQFKEVLSKEVAAGVQTGTIDAGDLDGSVDRFQEIAGYNSSGDITGDIITTNKVDNLGYGFIAINASRINVGGKSDSTESKNLRRALATVLSVYRNTAIDSYYGEAASVIQYPISNTSWAAPQATDEGYKVAFSTDIEGKQIYTSAMSADEKYEAAINASIAYFKAAGYTFDDASGKFTKAPEGAALAYEIHIPADGTGDHPSFAIMTDVKAALEKIGIKITVTDYADSAAFWEVQNSNGQDMWAAAWQATVDPDMYQTYHSSSTPAGEGTSTSNKYYLTDTQLDKLIVDARQSDDQAYRKSIYRQCLDIIIDWAVEVPVYQRQNCVVFSTERIDMSTMTPDITTFYPWMREVENIKMK